MNEQDVDALVTKLVDLPQTFIRKLGISLDEELMKIDLEMVHIMILHMLLLSETNPMMSEVGKKLSISNAMMTHIIDEMEKKKLVERVRDGDDRRVVKLSVTKRGQEILKKAGEHHKSMAMKFLAGLSKNDQADFLKAIETIHNILSANKGAVNEKSH
ncbi:MAG: hypothetical protein A2044_02725 [Candidatus Firestonebacteria bacterium GWA2_43_8]|nr:MAG: hypothetical protein A2044_02725 [Candidatus Firestonebacteria bacterium GWA2_43_8]